MLGDYVYTSMLGVDWSDLSLAVVGRKVTTPENFYSYDGKVANGCKNRPHDAYPVRCRVPGYYTSCSERVRVYRLKKCRQLAKFAPIGGVDWSDLSLAVVGRKVTNLRILVYLVTHDVYVVY